MIKNLYIHIGYPKAASSSIQKSLGQSTVLLQENGYLFPVFKVFGKMHLNHSIFFRNLFSDAQQHPIKNIRNHITTEEKQIQLINEFKKQLQDQLKNFEGENLIFSGEGIIHLKADGVKHIKEFFIDLLGPHCKFYLLLVTRNPVSRIQSNIQQNVREGGTLSFERIYKRNKLFHRTLTVFLEYFSVNDFKIISFEEAVSFPGGPAAKLLSEIGLPSEVIDKIPNVHANEKLTYEAMLILSAINEKIPFQLNGKLNPERENIRLNDFHKIPGTKFQLTYEQQKNIWQNSLHDIKWISEKFNRQEYKFDETHSNETEIFAQWNSVSLKAISLLLRKQNKIVKNIILKCVFTNLQLNIRKYSTKRIFGILFFLAKEKLKILNSNKQ